LKCLIVPSLIECGISEFTHTTFNAHAQKNLARLTTLPTAMYVRV